MFYTTPGQDESWVARFAEADTKNELHFSFYKPAALEEASDRALFAYYDVAD